MQSKENGGSISTVDSPGVVQILTKPTCPDLLFQIPIGRSNHTHFALERLGTAESLEFSFLNDT